MTTIDGLFAAGECNFSDHGANRLGASALMQGLADGYFILPSSIGNYLARHEPGHIASDHAEVRRAVASVHARLERLLTAPAARHPPEVFHRRLGLV